MGARQMEGPSGTQYKILVGWVLSFCPDSTIAIPKQCRGHGLFCLPRYVGRAISLPGWSAATSSSPAQDAAMTWTCLELAEPIMLGRGTPTPGLRRIPVPKVVHPYS